jgi:hypothetical protein
MNALTIDAKIKSIMIFTCIGCGKVLNLDDKCRLCGEGFQKNNESIICYPEIGHHEHKKCIAIEVVR